jgi:hypothetical protein
MEVSGQLNPALSARERATGNHWIGGWVNPSTGLDTVEYKESLVPVGNGFPVNLSLISIIVITIAQNQVA